MFRTRMFAARKFIIPSALPTYTAEATAWFAAHAVQLSDTQKTLVNTEIKTLVDAGEWAKLAVMWRPAMVTAQQGHINLINPAAHTLVPYNFASSFVSKVGYPAVSANSTYIDTNWVPRNDGYGKFTLNDGVFGVILKDNVQDDGVAGGVSFNGDMNIRPRTTSNDFTGTLNSATTIDTGNTDGSGLFALKRTGAVNIVMIKGTTVLATVAAASATLSDGNLFLYALNAGGTAGYFINANTIELFFAGSSSLDLAKIATFNANIKAGL